ncbi:MAG: hypothetical protein EA415_04420, partial [Sphaerobacteraceae bacterium]
MDRDNAQTFGSIRFLPLIDGRNLRPAGRSYAIPEDEHDWLAPQIFKGDWITIAPVSQAGKFRGKI